jgi:hypothetical protein
MFSLLINNSTEQSPSWEADSHSDSQEIPRLLRNPKVHYRVHKSPPLVPILRHMNPVHILTPYYLKPILILSHYLCLDLKTGLFRPGFPTKASYSFLTFPMRVTRPKEETIWLVYIYLRPHMRLSAYRPLWLRFIVLLLSIATRLGPVT